jgi:hypothetical protein
MRASLTVRSRHVERRGDRKTTAHREREQNPFLVRVLYDVKQVQAAEVSQRRTAVSSKCFQLYYHAQTVFWLSCPPPLLFPSFYPFTVTFPKFSLYHLGLYNICAWIKVQDQTFYTHAPSCLLINGQRTIHPMMLTQQMHIT